MGANLPYEIGMLLDYVRMHWCEDGLGFVRGRLGCFKNELDMAKGLFGTGWSILSGTLGLLCNRFRFADTPNFKAM